MKKKYFMIIICLCANFVMPAIATSSVLMQQEEQVVIKRKIINPNAQGQLPKSPAAPIYLIKEGHTLFCGFNFANCEIMLGSGSSIVYSGFTDVNGTISFPDYLEGTFEVSIIKESSIYVGEINL